MNSSTRRFNTKLRTLDRKTQEKHLNAIAMPKFSDAVNEKKTEFEKINYVIEKPELLYSPHLKILLERFVELEPKFKELYIKCGWKGCEFANNIFLENGHYRRLEKNLIEILTLPLGKLHFLGVAEIGSFLTAKKALFEAINRIVKKEQKTVNTGNRSTIVTKEVCDKAVIKSLLNQFNDSFQLVDKKTISDLTLSYDQLCEYQVALFYAGHLMDDGAIEKDYNGSLASLIKHAFAYLWHSVLNFYSPGSLKLDRVTDTFSEFIGNIEIILGAYGQLVTALQKKYPQIQCSILEYRTHESQRKAAMIGSGRHIQELCEAIQTHPIQFLEHRIQNIIHEYGAANFVQDQEDNAKHMVFKALEARFTKDKNDTVTRDTISNIFIDIFNGAIKKEEQVKYPALGNLMQVPRGFTAPSMDSGTLKDVAVFLKNNLFKKQVENNYKRIEQSEKQSSRTMTKFNQSSV